MGNSNIFYTFCGLILKTCSDFLLDTTVHELEETFNKFVTRADVAIILITQKVIAFLKEDHIDPVNHSLTSYLDVFHGLYTCQKLYQQ